MTDIAELVAENIDIWTGAIQRKSRAGRGGGRRISLYGVERLRALILDLAVRGKLVPQDEGDEPAGELVGRSAKALQVAIARGKFRAPAKISMSTATPGLPKNWTATRLGALVRVINGRAYKKQELLSSGTPVLRVGNLFTSNDWYYSDIDLENDKYITDGDLIYAWSASFGPFIWQGGRVIYHYHIWKLEPHSEADTSRDFLRLFLQNETSAIKASGHGIAMLHMTKERMEQLAINLPPLAEQRRIVAKVDELMALCDALERESADAMAAHQALVENLLATLMSSEDTATLVTNWARLESHFDDLFTTDASIESFKGAIIELAVTGGFTNTNSAAFKQKRLRDLLVFGPKNGFSPRAVDYDTGIKSLSLSATTKGNFDGLHYKFVDIETPNPESELWIKKGDILIQRANSLEYVGVSALYAGPDNSFIYPDLMMKVRFSADVISEFAVISLNSKPVRDYFRANASGTSGSMPKINQTTVLNATLQVPPLAEQRRIVAKVKALMALCDALKARLSDAAQTQRHLADAITERAAA